MVFLLNDAKTQARQSQTNYAFYLIFSFCREQQKKFFRALLKKKKNDCFVIKATNIFKSHRMVSFTILLMLFRSITRTSDHPQGQGSEPELYKAKRPVSGSYVLSVTSYPSMCSVRRTSSNNTELRMFY